jgi:hypothetical protein
LVALAVSSRWPGSHLNRRPGDTQGYIARSLAARRRSVLRVLQWAIAAAVIGFAAREVARQWNDVGPALSSLHPRWEWILVASVIVLGTYLLLIEAWRATLGIWAQRLNRSEAARIWFVSNLGKYVPGKIWQIAAMGALAQRAGVSATAAVGSSLLVNLASILTGFAIILGTGAREIASTVAGGSGERAIRLAIAGIAVAGGLALALAPFAVPRLAALTARLTRRPLVVPQVPAGAVWIAAVATAAAWAAYGVAFAIFANAISPSTTGNGSAYIAVYTGSYLAGYLALFAPGGVGIREAVLILAMPRFGLASAADAAVIAIASRLWLTLLEIIPGLFFLARRAARERRPADSTNETQ